MLHYVPIIAGLVALGGPLVETPHRGATGAGDLGGFAQTL